MPTIPFVGIALGACVAVLLADMKAAREDNDEISEPHYSNVHLIVKNFHNMIYEESTYSYQGVMEVIKLLLQLAFCITATKRSIPMADMLKNRNFN